LVVAIVFALLYTLGNRSSAYYVPAWLATLFGLGIVHWTLFFWIQRRRTREGIPVVEARRPSWGRIAVLTIALGTYLLAGCLLILRLGNYEAYRLILILPFGLAYGILWAVHGVQARQWEDIIQGAALGAITGTMAFVPRFPPEVWLILFAASFVPSGLVKHLRWRRWLRSMPADRLEPAAEGVRE
jgi:hypothetical protein